MHSTCFSLCGVGHLVRAATVALPRATRTSVQMGGAQVEAQTRYLPNTFQNCYWFSQHICTKFFKMCSLTFVCEMYRNLLLVGFDNAQRCNTIKCQQSTLLERCLLKVLHVSVWATIYEVEMSTNWLFLTYNIKCFVCNYISAVQLSMIRFTVVFHMVHHKGLLKMGGF